MGKYINPAIEALNTQIHSSLRKAVKGAKKITTMQRIVEAEKSRVKALQSIRGRLLGG